MAKDLFESYKDLPVDVQNIIIKWGDKDESYENCEKFLSDLKPFGYVFDYYLDAVLYNLRKIPTIESIKKGEYFKLKEDSSVVYVRGEYSQELKKYEAYKFDDVNHFIYKKKGTIVFTEFEF